MKIHIRRWVEINGKEAFSDAYAVDENSLTLWVLGRIKVPEFSTEDEMKNWIININHLVEPISGHPQGPIHSSQNRSKVVKPKKLKVETNDGAIYQLTGKKFTWQDKKIPKDYATLQSILQNEKPEELPIPSYGSWWGTEEKGRYQYDNIYVDHFIAFVTYKEQVIYKTPNGNVVELHNDETECWEFL